MPRCKTFRGSCLLWVLQMPVGSGPVRRQGETCKLLLHVSGRRESSYIPQQPLEIASSLASSILQAAQSSLTQGEDCS